MKIILCVLGILLLAIVIDFGRSYLLLRKGDVLADEAVSFQRSLPNAQMKILVLGDSTAVGTGAGDSNLSTAGRLGALYPQASVTNLARNGLKLQGLLEILQTIKPDDHYTIILMQIGANDIMRLTSMEDIARGIEKVVDELSKHTDTLVVLHSGDIGKTAFFPWILRPRLTKRSYEARDIYLRITEKYNAHYVDLINAPTSGLLNSGLRLYYAEDRLHLSGAGYGLWFAEIQKSL